MTPFYEKALTLFTNIQNRQIFKGLEKYGKPLTPADLTGDELFEHAMEEQVDGVHYILGLKELIDNQADYIQQLEQELRYLKSENTRLSPKKAPYDDIDDQ